MLTGFDFKRDELRQVWEAKCLCPSEGAVAARRKKATDRLRLRGMVEPSLAAIDRERHALEEERFCVWLAEKRFNGFDRV